MFNIGTPELLVILLIALIVVGPRRLPELGRTLGRGLREFRKVQDDVRDMVKLDLDEDTSSAGPRRSVPKEPVTRPPAATRTEPTHTEPAADRAESTGDGPTTSGETVDPVDPAGDGPAGASSSG